MSNSYDSDHTLLRLISQKLDEKYPSHLQVQLSSFVLFADEKMGLSCINELRRQSFIVALQSEIEDELHYLEILQCSNQYHFALLRQRLRRIIFICPERYNYQQSAFNRRLHNLFQHIIVLTPAYFFNVYIPKFRNNDEVMYSIWTIIYRMDSNLIRDSVIRALDLDVGRFPNLNKSAYDAVVKNFVISFYDPSHTHYMGFTEKLDPQDEIFLYNVVPSSFDFRVGHYRQYGMYLDKFNIQTHQSAKSTGYSTEQLNQLTESDESLPFYAPLQFIPKQCDDPASAHFYINDCKYKYIYYLYPANYPFPRLLVNTFNLLKINESIQKTEKDLTRTAAKLATYYRMWEQYYYTAAHALVKMIYLNIDDSERIIDNIYYQINLMRSKRHRPQIDISSTNFLYSAYNEQTHAKKMQALQQHRFPRIPLRVMLTDDRAYAQAQFGRYVRETVDIYKSSISLVLYNSVAQKLGVELRESERVYLEASLNVDVAALCEALFEFCNRRLELAYMDTRFFMDVDEMEVIVACALRNSAFKLLLCGFFNSGALEPDFDGFNKIRFFQDYSSIIRKYQMKRKNVRDCQVDFTMQTARLSPKLVWLVVTTLNDSITVHFTQPELMESAYKILKNSRHYTSFDTIQLLAQYVHVGRRQKQFTYPISNKNEQEYSHYYYKEGKAPISESMLAPPQENPQPGKCNICKFGVDYQFPNYKEHIRSQEHIDNYRKELGADVERLKRHASGTRSQQIVQYLTAMCAVIAKENSIDFSKFTEEFNILLRNIGISVVVDDQDLATNDPVIFTDEFRQWRTEVLEYRFTAFEQVVGDDTAPEFESSVIACAYLIYQQNNISRNIKDTMRRIIEYYGSEQDRLMVYIQPEPITLNYAQESRFTGVSDVVGHDKLYNMFSYAAESIDSKLDCFPTMTQLSDTECRIIQEQTRHQLNLLLSPQQDQYFDDELIEFVKLKMRRKPSCNMEIAAKALLVRTRNEAKQKVDDYEMHNIPFSTGYKPLDSYDQVQQKLKLPDDVVKYLYAPTLILPPLYHKSQSEISLYASKLQNMSMCYKSLNELIAAESVSISGLVFSIYKNAEQMELLSSYNPVYRDDAGYRAQLEYSERQGCGRCTANKSCPACATCTAHQTKCAACQECPTCTRKLSVSFCDDTDLELFSESVPMYADSFVLSDNCTLLKSSSDMQTHRQSSMESTDLRLYERQMYNRQRACGRMLARHAIQRARLAQRLASFPQIAVPNEFPQQSTYEYSVVIAYSRLIRLKIPEKAVSAQPMRGFDYYADAAITFETINPSVVDSVAALLMAYTAPTIVSGAAYFVTNAAFTSIGLGFQRNEFDAQQVVCAAANARATDQQSCRETFLNGKTCNRRVARTGLW